MVERRFRDMGRAIRIFGETHGEWDEILPIFLLATRNKVNKTTGFSPAMLLFGQELRLPNAIDAKVEEYHDQSTEYQKLLNRRALVDKVVHDKKYKLFQESEQEAQHRLELADWRVGQKAYMYVDRRIIGESRKGTISWCGPFDVVEVRKTTLVLLKNGKRVTANMTKCVGLKEPKIPDRDMRGRALDKEATDKKEQDRIMKAKVERLAPKLKTKARRTSVSDSEEELEEESAEEDDSPEEQKLRKLARQRPLKKRTYGLDHLRDNSIDVIWAFEAMRLAKFMFARCVPGDKEPWVRFHLYGSEQRLTERNRAFRPTWKTGNRDVLATEKRRGFAPFWVDIYLQDVLYVLKHPLKDGVMDERDVQEMGYGEDIVTLFLAPVARR